VTTRNPGHPASADQPGDDFRRITGIGAKREQRLHEQGILTYHDLAACSPERIAAILADEAGLSAARIAGQDWTGQASQLAGPAAPPLPSEPSQHYASFHIELLLDVDDSVRRTKVHHHQSDTDEAWAGWDEDRLLALLRDHIPLMASRPPAEPADLPPAAEPSSAAEPPPAGPADLSSAAESPPAPPETADVSGNRPQAADLPASMPASLLRVEGLRLTRAGQSSHLWAPSEPISIGLTLRVDRAAGPPAAALDFTADITARSELGDDRRCPLGTVEGAVRVDEPLPVELTGRPLPRGLHRLEASVLIYPAGHTPGSQPLLSRRASGALIQVVDVAPQTTPGRT
jgi:predicted flap endonuclease-1-like 5' DNA nuclease